MKHFLLLKFHTVNCRNQRTFIWHRQQILLVWMKIGTFKLTFLIFTFKNLRQTEVVFATMQLEQYSSTSDLFTPKLSTVGMAETRRHIQWQIMISHIHSHVSHSQSFVKAWFSIENAFPVSGLIFYVECNKNHCISHKGSTSLQNHEKFYLHNVIKLVIQHSIYYEASYLE